jgi:hypothetical protein
MVWLSEISPWTWAAFGLGWVGVSGALALVLGKVLARTNEAAEQEELALERAKAARALSQPVAQYEPAVSDWFSQAAAPDFDEEADEYAGRAQSGTMFKAIKVEGEQEESAAENVRPLRRAR